MDIEKRRSMLRRRNFIVAGGGLLAGAGMSWLVAGTGSKKSVKTVLSPSDIEQLQTHWSALTPTDADLPTLNQTINVSKSQWKQELSPKVFHILFEAGTERAGSSPLDSEKRSGLFLCAACELPLFSSAMKYDSRTGWPSFFTAIPNHLQTSTDYKLIVPRTEYHCARCGGHQGHRFTDGPAPTHERWCNNGLLSKVAVAANAFEYRIWASLLRLWSNPEAWLVDQ